MMEWGNIGRGTDRGMTGKIWWEGLLKRVSLTAALIHKL